MRVSLLVRCCSLAALLALTACPGPKPEPTPASPDITTDALPAGVVGVPYHVALAAQGGTGQKQWSLSGGALPPGITLSTDGMLQGTPTGAGASALGIQVQDEVGQRDTATLLLEVVQPLALTGRTLPSGVVGQAYSASLAVSGGKAPFSLAVVEGQLPAGLALEGSALAGTPTAEGQSSFVLEVTDASSQRSRASFTLSVSADEQGTEQLAVATAQLPEAAPGVAYSHTLTATGGRAPYQWRLLSNPGAVALTLSSTGVLGGTPTASGTFLLQVEVKDAEARVATATLTLHVRGTLNITTESLADAYRTQAFSQQLAVDGAGAATWSVASGSLPAGLALSASGLLSGTPSALGASTFTVRAVRGSDETVRTFQLSVYDVPSLQATTALPDAYVGDAVSQSLSASGGKAPLTFAVTAGTLAPGLSLSEAGLLSGTASGAGRFSATVTLSDANGRTAQGTVKLDVYQAPVLTGATLPLAEVGQAYSHQLAGSQGRGALTYAVTGGALPRGLSLSASGLLSGHGALVGSRTFTVTATDENGRSAQASFTLQTVLDRGLGVVAWNVASFGHDTQGPSSSGVGDVTQIENVRSVLLQGGWDVAALTEVVDATDFQSLVAGMPGHAGLLASDATVSGSTNFSATELKPAVIWKTAEVQLLQAQAIMAGSCFESSTGTAFDAWAGRPPLEVVLQTLGAPVATLHLIVVHLKAGVAESDRLRRAAASACLESYVDGLPTGRRALILGTFNDDMDVSITGGTTPFANFTQRVDYYPLHYAFSMAGVTSTAGYTDMVDHQLVNQALATDFHVRSQEVVRPDLQMGISDYTNTTTDHYPVTARYAIGDSPAPGGAFVFMNEVRFTELAAPNFDDEFVELVNVGDAPADLSGWQLQDGMAIRHVFPLGTVLQPGKALVVFAGQSALSQAPGNAMVASTGTLSFHPSDSVRLYDGRGVYLEGLQWSADVTPGVSANSVLDGVPGQGYTLHPNLGSLPASPGRLADGSAF